MINKSLLVVGLACLLTSGLASADSAADKAVSGEDAGLKFVRGQNWTNSSAAERNAYLYGLGNMFELQKALVDDPAATQKFNDVMIRGLSSMDMPGVKKALNDWYAAHPEDSKRPVLSVLYHEIALPRATSK